MAHKSRSNTVPRKRVVTRAIPQNNKNESVERFEVLSGWEADDLEHRPSPTNTKGDDDKPDHAVSDDGQAPSWASPRANTNIETTSKAVNTSSPDEEEKDTREKFVRALHSAWASATSKANSDTRAHQAFNEDHPQSLDERLSIMGDKELSNKIGASASDRVLNQKHQGEVSHQNTAQQSTASASLAHHGRAFNEEGLQGIVDKLRPDVIGIHPDDRLIPAPKQKRVIQWSGATIAMAALIGTGLGALLLYQNIWLIDNSENSGWQMPPAFTTQKVVSAPMAAATSRQPIENISEQPAGLNHTPPPRAPQSAIKAEAKIQERIVTTPPAPPVEPVMEAPLPVAPPIKLIVAAPVLKTAKVAPANIIHKKETPNVTIVESMPPATASVKADIVTQATTPPPVAINQIVPPLTTKWAPPVVLPAPPVMVITPAAELPKHQNALPVKDKTPEQTTQRIARLDPESMTTQPESTSATPPLAIAQTSQRGLSENDTMVAQADKHMISGDISSARLLYVHAAQAGSAEAAFKLAQTYDPIAMENIKVYGVQPNPELAQKWYQFASSHGNSLASQRLRALKVWLARIDQFKN